MLIIEIWKNQPGKFFCLATKDGGGNFKEHFFTPDEFGSIKKFLKDQKDKDIYWCPHGFNRRVRQKSEAVIPNLLWADLDFADPRDNDDFKGVKPTYLIESSPGRFVGVWDLKEPMTEDINRRLTYKIGADKGGWDLTQLLRVPGTTNYKYRSRPTVRVMWDDGPVYSLKRIERHLPEEEKGDDGEILSAAAVWEEFEHKIPRWARKEIIAKKIVGRVDRSEMLWKLENVCIEVGMSIDEAVAVLKGSIWNKFAGRRNEDVQLRRELSKIVGHQFSQRGSGAEKRRFKSDMEESQEDAEPNKRFNFLAIKEIEEEELEWLWWPYLAKRTLSVLEGDPGLGKSYLAQMVCAKIAAGERVPCSRKGKVAAHGPVVYFDMENDTRAVTKPRLRMNGYGNLKNYYPVEEPFTIDDEEAMDEIYEALEKIKPVLIVFDTLNVYIGRADTHKASEAAQAMSTFKKMASDFDCAVLVLRHLVKASGAAINAGQGSMSITGTARIIMTCGVDPDDSDTRGMAVTKTNIGVKPQALMFRIEGRKNDESEFVWDGFKNLNTQDLIDAAREMRKTGGQGGGIQDAMEFLEGMITGKRLEKERLERMAEKRSIDLKMLERAANKLGVTEKEVKGVMTWRLPKKQDVEDDEEETMH